MNVGLRAILGVVLELCGGAVAMCCAFDWVRIAGGAVRGALGSLTAGAVAGASASDADVSEACSAHAVVERPDDWESKVWLANDLFHGAMLRNSKLEHTNY